MHQRLVGVAISIAGILFLALAGASAPVRSAHLRGATFTETQAKQGAHDYTQYCASCHGADLLGPLQAPLKGPAFVSLGKDTGMTLGTFFDFIVRETPAGRPSLSHDQYVAIMAFILRENGYTPGTTPMRFERELQDRSLVGERPENAELQRRDSRRFK